LPRVVKCALAARNHGSPPRFGMQPGGDVIAGRMKKGAELHHLFGAISSHRISLWRPVLVPARCKPEAIEARTPRRPVTLHNIIPRAPHRSASEGPRFADWMVSNGHWAARPGRRFLLTRNRLSPAGGKVRGSVTEWAELHLAPGPKGHAEKVAQGALWKIIARRV
jgi:hypothetical protein